VNEFISHIVDRHINSENFIVPRVPGKFESFDPGQRNPGEINSIESNVFNNDGTDAANIDTKKTLFQTSARDSLEDFSSTGRTLNIAKQDDVTPPFSMPEKRIDNVNKAPFFSENIPRKTPVLSTIEKGIDEFASATENMSLNRIQNNNLFNAVRPALTENNQNPFSQKEQTQKKPEDGSSSFTLVKNKASFENPRSIFQEKFQQETLPVIKISIGRIDVRAIVSSPATKSTEQVSQGPNMSLDDYLKKRNNTK
jgi:hypothetical protein